jgi:hypothetical protein
MSKMIDQDQSVLATPGLRPHTVAATVAVADWIFRLGASVHLRKSQGVRKGGIGHVTLTIIGLEQSFKFYLEAVGLDFYYRILTGASSLNGSKHAVFFCLPPPAGIKV